MRRRDHALQGRCKYSPYGNVAGAERIGAQHLSVAMAAQAEPQASSPDAVQIGKFKVFLSQMHAISAGLNGQLPVVVDEQQGVGALNRLNCRSDFSRCSHKVI